MKRTGPLLTEETMATRGEEKGEKRRERRRRKRNKGWSREKTYEVGVHHRGDIWRRHSKKGLAARAGQRCS